MTRSELRREVRRLLFAAAEKQPSVALDAPYEADELLRLVCGLSRETVLMTGAESVEDALVKRCFSVCEGRAAGEPLAYLTGFAPFFGLDIAVRRGCLIPRADTEVLVEEALREIPAGGMLFDLCTGTGCIPCAVLSARADVTAFGVDIADDALVCAKENAARCGLAARFTVCRGDVLNGDLPTMQKPSVIVSNPPYISTAVCRTLDIQVQREPLLALDGGADGLRFYRAIFENYKTVLADGGCFLLEIGYDEGEALRALCREHGFSFALRQDYGGNDRVVIARKA